MADYRSKFYTNENMQIEPYYGPPISTTSRPNDFRSYSDSSYAASYYHHAPPPQAAAPPPEKLKKGKSENGSSSKSWVLNDAEFQRKKRVASYKAYSAEGKVKGSFRKSFRWLKDKYTQVVYGWW